ncbi:MAG: glycosyltransferase family 4 protein [Candidatus Pacebacteria bacterium]|nr:glycosyltransferase family 4 protein [Candidatus Paceibacterota bacterium]
MNVLFLTVGLGKGGAEKILSEICLKSSKHGLPLASTVISFTDGPYRNILENSGVRCRVLVRKNAPLTVAIWFLTFVLLIIRLKKSTDIIHAFTPKGGLLGVFAKFFISKPLVYSVRCTPSISILFFKKPVSSICHTIAARCADIVQCNSKYVKQEVDKKYHISSCLAPNGIDLAETDSKIKAKQNNNNGVKKEFSILTICNLREKNEKDIKTIIDVAVKLKSISFAVLGAGKYLQYFVRYAQKQGAENVCFVGYQENVFDYLTKADCYIHLTSTEGFSNSILEAMAAMVPVIASNIPQISGLFMDKKHCLLVENKNIPAIIEAINKIKNDGSLSLFLAKNARSLLEKEYSIEQTLKINYQMYCDFANVPKTNV